MPPLQVSSRDDPYYHIQTVGIVQGTRHREHQVPGNALLSVDGRRDIMTINAERMGDGISTPKKKHTHLISDHHCRRRRNWFRHGARSAPSLDMSALASLTYSLQHLRAAACEPARRRQVHGARGAIRVLSFAPSPV